MSDLLKVSWSFQILQ